MQEAKRTLVVALALLWLSVPAVAMGSRVVQTDCDTLSMEPLTVRVTFAIDNYAPSQVTGVVRLWSNCLAAGDHCCIVGCGSPAPWIAQLWTDHPGSGAWWHVESSQWFLYPGQRQDGFYVDYEPTGCCFGIDVLDTVMGRLIWQEQACFVLDAAVPTQPCTWAQVKARHR